MDNCNTEQLLAELDAIECRIEATCKQIALAGREHASLDPAVHEDPPRDPLASLRQLLHESNEE